KKRLIEVQKQPFSISDLKVSGHDVMEIYQCKSGPIIGQVLTALFKEVEKQSLPNKRDILLNKIEKIKNSKLQ
ncbi:hypothetical protein ACFL1P_00525, partial [Patescibacteria group bacterium]